MMLNEKARNTSMKMMEEELDGRDPYNYQIPLPNTGDKM
jgi:hypothetical protein